MRNSLISICLFIILLLGIFYLNNGFIKICDNTEISINEIEELILNTEYDLAYEKSEELLSYIDDHDGIPTIYLDHTDYDSVINECLKLCIYLQERDISEAVASLHLVKYSVTHLKDLQTINLKNIF